MLDLPGSFLAYLLHSTCRKVPTQAMLTLLVRDLDCMLQYLYRSGPVLTHAGSTGLPNQGKHAGHAPWGLAETTGSQGILF